ncbi:MAG: ketoacyl-ACP synthase III [Alphaproteobacteria bacterium]|nr:ketoacyl-ACP synthase III [Alphaproteobacteria bacterium]
MKGYGSYLPDRVITNTELSESIDTSHDWIVERTGIHQRHFASDAEVTSDLATHAARQAIERAGIEPNDIDIIIVGTATPDKTFPATATRVQHKLGITRGFAFDVSAVCAGFLLAMSVADKFMITGSAKNVLIIGAETPSRIINMQDRRTSVLFGDGAGAWVLQAQPSKGTLGDQGILDTAVYSDGQFGDLLHTDGGPSSTGKVGHILMEGREVYRHAVEKLSETAQTMLARNNLTVDDIDWFIPHQANSRIIDAVAKRLNMPQEKIVLTVHKHANTSAASIPLAFAEAVDDGRVQRGDLILHEAIGGGLVWGSALVRF